MSHKETKKMGTDAASSYVTRISGLALMLAVVTPSEGARYLVKLRHGSSADRFTRRMVAASNVRALNSELRAASSMGLNATRPLANLGIVVVDGNDESVKSVLKDHPLVDFYEREVTWKTSFADGDTPPSTQAAAP